MEFLEVEGWKGRIPGRGWNSGLVEGGRVEVLVEGGIPDWWKAEAGATR